MPPVGSVSAPVIIGRDRELAAIRSLLQPETGGGTVLLSGEGGLGKSRLLREAISEAEALGYRVLSGACFDRDQTLPYAPFLDLLRAYAVHAEDARERLVIVALGFARLLPEMARPLADPAVVIEGRSLQIRRGEAVAEPSGQLLMDFDAPRGGPVANLDDADRMAIPIAAAGGFRSGGSLPDLPDYPPVDELRSLAAELEEGNVLLSVATPSDEAAEHVTALLEAHGARVAPRRHERRERE